MLLWLNYAQGYENEMNVIYKKEIFLDIQKNDNGLIFYKDADSM